jgi:formylglycine-generating enzyme required for sulfatase activity/tRNA A-37 threonylcarbamoyl transferase component Bud32
MSQAPEDWVGHTFGGRYRIEEKLAEGGMSRVYKAYDPNLHRAVAIKLIHPHLSIDPEFIRRFEQEAASVAQLRHPNIVQVYDFNQEAGVYFMVLEYVPGQTLHDLLKALNASNQRLPLTTTVPIMATICDAVAYAHHKAMIHRDLKPANVMLNQHGEPILMDFGVAKMLGETQHTMTGAVIGTALYMSPEQAQGAAVDSRTDIYSLGVVLFEMITGRPPFEGDSAVAIMMKHVTEPVPDICEIDKNVPDGLVTVVQKALAKDPAQRFQTAAQMGAALRSADAALGAGSATILTPAPTAGPLPEPVVPAAAPSSERVVLATGAPPSAPAFPPTTVPPKKRSWLPLAAGLALGVIAILALGVGALYLAWQYIGPRVLARAEGLPSATGMVYVNEGRYLVGLDSTDKEHVTPLQVELKQFWIDQYEVTNAQYAKFLAATGNPAPAGWRDGQPPVDKSNYPVQGVTWNMADAYCKWAGKRLPTEAEWEVAARGPQGLLYPWGDDQHALQLPQSETYPVGSYPADRSPFRAYDMAGNVWEWVGEPYAPIEAGNRVLRGGGYGYLKDMAYRLEGDPRVPTMIAAAGMRCAADRVTGGEQAEKTPLVLPSQRGVLFQDDFGDPKSGWPTGEVADGHFGYHPAAFYHVEVSKPNGSLTVFRGLDFANFTVETEVLVDHTNTQNGDFRYGLAFRRIEDNYYAFVISPRTDTWQVLKHSAAGFEVLAEGKNNSLRGLTAPDFLQVDADGSDLTFHINGQTVTHVSDASYAGGDIGFLVETVDETLAHIHYASLTVREVAKQSSSQHVHVADDFKDPNSGWPTFTDPDQTFGYHPPDYYHVQASRPHDRVIVTRETSYGNVSIETQVFVDHTGDQYGDFRYGLVFRRSGDSYYAFTISPRSKHWQILKAAPGSLDVLQEGNNDSIVGLTAGQEDTLRVDANGSDFTFFLNNQSVAQLKDSSYVTGAIGFMVETFDESLAHIHYDSLTIDSIP